MKTNTNKKATPGAPSRSEYASTEQNSSESGSRTGQPAISFERRRANRALGTEQLLALLRNEAPRFFELAEVVGKWVWIQFSEKQPSEITRALSELGFHWNNRRQIWQHPCGLLPQRSPQDPREKYGSHFATDPKAN